jgi:hypothetical protein
MDYKNSKWAKRIIELQQDNGSWGFFHTFYNNYRKIEINTEQALRRLYILGYTNNDLSIKKAIKYMHNCLNKNIKYPDRPEGSVEENYKNFYIAVDLMLATWIKLFTNDDKLANDTIKKWAYIINASFENNMYDNNKYLSAYEKIFGKKYKHGGFDNSAAGIVNFYFVSSLANELDKNSEPIFFKHILENERGIYYIYHENLKILPDDFQTKKASGFISAMELLSKYNNENCKKQLYYVKAWLVKNSINKIEWDMGKEAKDNINFPLSDSWKKNEDRINDCTYRIRRLIEKINV